MTSLANLKIGFIGGGNMASALIGGLINQGALAKNMFVADPFDQTRQRLERDLSIICAASVDKLAPHIENCDVLVMAVKPQQFKEAATELSLVLKSHASKPLCLSVAAGIKTADMAKWLGHQRIIRAMPNTPALVGQGAAGYCLGSRATRADAAVAQSLLGAVGLAVEVAERLMNAVTGLSGSGPAYIYLVIDALADGGVQAGIPRADAIRLAAQTVLGSATMVLETGEHPAVLKDMVTSPGGTTIAALAVLEKRGLRSALIEAVGAAVNRATELGK